jgi:hypothetical protein
MPRNASSASTHWSPSARQRVQADAAALAEFAPAEGPGSFEERLDQLPVHLLGAHLLVERVQNVLLDDVVEVGGGEG